MTVLLLILSLLGSDGETPPLFSGLQPDQYIVKRLPKLYSPTAITAVKDKLYIGCDLLDARPGIYRYDAETEQTTLVYHLPQTELRGLSTSEERLVAASARVFSSQPKDWQAKAFTFEIGRKQALDTIDLELPAKCSSGEFKCGLSAVVMVSPDKLLAITQNPSQVYIYTRKESGQWSSDRNMLVTLGRQSATISEAAIVGDQLVFLVRNRWQLSAVPLASVFEPSTWRLVSEPVFDLTPLKKDFPIKVTSMTSNGYAEGFAFANDRLYIVLDNRGYDFSLDRDEGDLVSPVLIVYEKHKQPAPTVVKTPADLPEPDEEQR